MITLSSEAYIHVEETLGFAIVIDQLGNLLWPDHDTASSACEPGNITLRRM
jgi:hypothetical protein